MEFYKHTCSRYAYVYLIFMLAVFFESTCSAGFDLQDQKVLLISVDGMRYDVLEKHPAVTPNLHWFLANGVTAGHVINVFPTITLPNHQSIVTGLYPENHGLIANTMYNRKTKEKFYIANTEAKFWNDATPIWMENELQGHKSGVCFWPGYDVLFNGKQATYLPPANYTSPLDEENLLKNMPWDRRADLAIDWLKKDDVTFVALYIDDPDVTEHGVGPDPSDKDGLEKLREAFGKVDETIGRVMHKIKTGGLQSNVNVIIIGDHGQVNTDPKNKVVDLTKYVNLNQDAELVGDGFIYAKPNMTEALYEKLKKAEKNETHFKVYLKKDIPDYLHVRNHERTGDIMLLPDPGWQLWLFGSLDPSQLGKGGHGFDTKVKDMHPAFFAYGPLLRHNYHEEIVYTVDVYSLMCYILKIKPKPNDGNFDRIKSILLEKYA